MSSVLRFPRLLTGSRLARFYYSYLLTRLLTLVIYDLLLYLLSSPRPAIRAMDYGIAIYDLASRYRGSRLTATGSLISPGNR